MVVDAVEAGDTLTDAAETDDEATTLLVVLVAMPADSPAKVTTLAVRAATLSRASRRRAADRAAARDARGS